MKSEDKTACEVIKQRKQFSFVTKKTKWEATEGQLERLDFVRDMPRVLGKSYKWFFHVDIWPKWADNMSCKRIGNHRFCKLKEK
jgi:spore germination cell wall hydrolase CwlJ-like protein